MSGVTLANALKLRTFVYHSATRMEPLKINTRKQLFVDAQLVHSRDNLTRVMHQPVPYKGNPILEGDRPWEKWSISLNGRPVLYDEDDRLFKMWYSATLSEPQAPRGLRYKVCYATSEDGIRWERPILNQVEWQGSRANNILRWGSNWMRRPNVIKDEHDPDPDRRYKMIYADVIQPTENIACEAKAISRDGVVWNLNVDGKPIYPRHNANLLGWDPRIERYVWFGRCGDPKTAIGRATSSDFLKLGLGGLCNGAGAGTGRPGKNISRTGRVLLRGYVPGSALGAG